MVDCCIEKDETRRDFEGDYKALHRVQAVGVHHGDLHLKDLKHISFDESSTHF